MMRLPVLTTSEERTFKRCQRLHHYRYDLGYHPVAKADALKFGDAFHLALESWWTSPAMKLESGIQALRSVKTLTPFELVQAEELLRGYDARWIEYEFEVLGIEKEFYAELRNPKTNRPSRNFRRAGKLDVIVRDRSGRVLVVEHKTSAEDFTPGSDYRRRLILDPQISNYMVGARALGFEPSGCLYDVIGKVKLRPFKATPEADRKYKKTGELYATQRERDETPDEYRSRVRDDIAANAEKYFARVEAVRFPEEEVDSAYDTWQTAVNIREGRLAKSFPRNPDACVRYGRTCDFFDVCSGTASLDDDLKFTQSTNVHPELSSESEEAAE